MRKKNPGYKEWKNKSDSKKHRLNVLSKRYRKIIKSNNRINKINNKNKKSSDSQFVKVKTFNVPENFSIINNAQVVMSFFNEIEYYIQYNRYKTRIQINMSNIIDITVDALLYLLALIQNLKVGGLVTQISGNLPLNEEAKMIVQKSGFLRHIQRTRAKTEFDSDKIQIRSGKYVDTPLIGEICDFINQRSELNIVNTRFLYTIIGEMMGNSFEHAYDKDENYAQTWMLYVEKNNGTFKFIFLDTGVGVISTMKKKFFERISNSKDSDILISAFEGEIRTRTKKSYRGKGLPSISKYISNKDVYKMNVITNNACINICSTGEKYKKIDMKGSLNGTLYYWEVITDGMEENNDYNFSS